MSKLTQDILYRALQIADRATIQEALRSWGLVPTGNQGLDRVLLEDQLAKMGCIVECTRVYLSADNQLFIEIPTKEDK